MRFHWVDLNKEDNVVKAFISFVHTGDQNIEYIIVPNGKIITQAEFRKSDYMERGFIQDYIEYEFTDNGKHLFTLVDSDGNKKTEEVNIQHIGIDSSETDQK